MGGLTIDLASRNVTTVSGTTGQRFTPTEWELLETLARNPGRLISHAELGRRVWGHDHRGGDSLHVYIARLRRKLEPSPTRPRYLITEPGMVTDSSRDLTDARPATAGVAGSVR